MVSDEEEQFVDVDIKVIIPAGQVIAMRKDNPAELAWSHKVFIIVKLLSLIEIELLTS